MYDSSLQSRSNCFLTFYSLLNLRIKQKCFTEELHLVDFPSSFRSHRWHDPERVRFSSRLKQTRKKMWADEIAIATGSHAIAGEPWKAKSWSQRLWFQSKYNNEPVKNVFPMIVYELLPSLLNASTIKSVISFRRTRPSKPTVHRHFWMEWNGRDYPIEGLRYLFHRWC